MVGESEIVIYGMITVDKDPEPFAMVLADSYELQGDNPSIKMMVKNIFQISKKTRKGNEYLFSF